MTAIADTLPFRFDSDRHLYLPLMDGRDPYPHITGMLEACGLADSTWCTEESLRRGTAVHKLTADYDLGALDVASCTSAYRGWLLAHVAAMAVLQPETLAVEEPIVHTVHQFGGRPDRVWRYDGGIAVAEIKSGPFDSVHQVQTALQAILISARYRLPPRSILRFGLYLKENGRYKVEQFAERGDFDEAMRVIHRCC